MQEGKWVQIQYGSGQITVRINYEDETCMAFAPVTAQQARGLAQALIEWAFVQEAEEGRRG